jgi:AraC family transcriptional regulator
MSYIERIQNSIEYIHCNYSNVITLDDLAGKAFCSKYHYLRVFHALIGKSPIVFSRIFKDAFGVTPSLFKKSNIPLPIFKEIKLGNDKAFGKSKNILLGPRFIERKDFIVIGMQCRTTAESNLQNHVVEKLWQKFCPRINQIPYRIKYGESFGVNCFDSSINRYVYTACVEVSRAENIPKDMVSKIIPECKYAVFTIMEEQNKLLKNFYYSID